MKDARDLVDASELAQPQRTHHRRRLTQNEIRQHRFEPEAVARLQKVFRTNPIPDRAERLALAWELNVSERQVQVWLQNKRQRTKARRLRELNRQSQEPEAESTPIVPTEKQEGEACLVDGLEMDVFVQGHQPFQVLWASTGWLTFCGFSQSELKGQTMRILQGPETDGDDAKELSTAGVERRCGEATLINYTKSGIAFRHRIKIEPLVNAYGQLRLFRARSSEIEVLDQPDDEGEDNEESEVGKEPARYFDGFDDVAAYLY